MPNTKYLKLIDFILNGHVSEVPVEFYSHSPGVIGKLHKAKKGGEIYCESRVSCEKIKCEGKICSLCEDICEGVVTTRRRFTVLRFKDEDGEELVKFEKHEANNFIFFKVRSEDGVEGVLVSNTENRRSIFIPDSIFDIKLQQIQS